MDIKRPKTFLLLLILPLVYLMCVILNISIFKSSQYSFMAANQRKETDKAERGIICDRNFIPLTFSDRRYGEDSVARHIIGYLDSYGGGASGIEKSFNKELAQTSGEKSYSLKDANGNDIEAFKSSKEKTAPQYVKLTIDYHIQKHTENVLDKYDFTGAAVVLAIESSDVLASASRPNFNQNSIAEYLNGHSTALLNRANSAYDISEFSNFLMPITNKNNISPTDAAAFMAAAARKGAEEVVNITDGIYSENGHLIKSYRKSKTTKKEVQTASIPDEIFGTYWAIGYFPKEAPKYALAVYTENPNICAGDVYNDIKNDITDLNR